MQALVSLILSPLSLSHSLSPLSLSLSLSLYHLLSKSANSLDPEDLRRLAKPNQGQTGIPRIKAAHSVTFHLLILELMFLFFKNTVKKLKFRYTFYQFRKSKQVISIKTTSLTLKLPVYNYWRDANNYHHEKNTPVL